MEIKTFEEIYRDMRNYVIAHQDRLTDFNDGGVLASFMEATAREMNLLYINCRVGFSSFMRGLPYSVFGFEKIDGTPASAKLVFSRSRPFSHESQIPTNTRVSAGGLEFRTTEVGKIKTGEVESGSITAVSASIGERFNVGSFAINKIVSSLQADIIKVENSEPATGGTENEDWASYIDRFAMYILGLQRTNKMGFITALIEDGLIRSYDDIEHFPPVDDIWNLTMYLEDGSGSISDEDLLKAKEKIDGVTISGISGYRPPGINIRYKRPEIIPLKVGVTIFVESSIRSHLNLSTVEDDIKKTVQEYINAHVIFQPFLIAGLIVELKGLVKVGNVHVTYPEADVFIEHGEIVRYESCDVRVII